MKTSLIIFLVLSEAIASNLRNLEASLALKKLLMTVSQLQHYCQLVILQHLVYNQPRKLLNVILSQTSRNLPLKD